MKRMRYIGDQKFPPTVLIGQSPNFVFRKEKERHFFVKCLLFIIAIGVFIFLWTL